MDAPTFHYWRGYPRRHLGDCTLSLINCFLIMSFFNALACFGVVTAVYGIHVAGWGIWEIILFCFCSWMLYSLVPGTITGLYDCFKARIVPFFNQRVNSGTLASDPGWEAFLNGHALAQNCKHLDSIALKAGVAPISAFGFTDKDEDDGPTWHDPEEGLKSLQTLIEVLKCNHGDIADSKAVVSDLERIQLALQAAKKQGILFALILRNGSDKVISPVEMDNRKPYSFW